MDAYYRAEILYAQVLELLHLDDRERGSDHEEVKATKLADLLLTTAQVERMLCLPHETASAVAENILGVTPTLLRQATGLVDDRTVEFHRDAARLALLPLVEDKLREKCTDVCDIVLPELMDRTKRDGTHLKSLEIPSLARQAMEIPSLLVEIQSLKAEKADNLVRLQRQVDMQLVDDIKRLQSMIHALHRLLREHKQQDIPRVVQVKTQWLAAYSRAISTRARLVSSQVRADTYSRDHISVLQHTHEGLIERQRRAQEERDQLLAKLHLYRAADSEYQAIVREYGFVLQGIEEKRKWIRSLNM